MKNILLVLFVLLISIRTYASDFDCANQYTLAALQNAREHSLSAYQTRIAIMNKVSLHCGGFSDYRKNVELAAGISHGIKDFSSGEQMSEEDVSNIIKEGLVPLTSESKP